PERDVMRDLGGDMKPGARRRVIVSGFQPFGPWSENTSLWAARAAGEAAARLAERPGGDGSGWLLAAELPVEFDRAADLLLRLARREGAAEVVALGMAGKSEEVRVEVRAANEDSADLPDNAGVSRRGERIDRGGPPALEPSYPAEAMAAFFR